MYPSEFILRKTVIPSSSKCAETKLLLLTSQEHLFRYIFFHATKPLSKTTQTLSFVLQTSLATLGLISRAHQ